MKRIKLIYALLLAVTLPLLTACYNDEAVKIDDEPIQQDGKITVHLRVSQAAPAVTRAEESSKWEDSNATDDEMMNVWTVIAVHDDDGNKNKVAAIYTCNPQGDPEQEVDDVINDEVELPMAGEYYFYSFANMSATELSKLLFDDQTTIPAATGTNSIVSKTTGLEGKTLVKGDVEEIAVKVQGNGFNPLEDDNGFGAKGIPMSNVQKLTVTDKGAADLIVIRMLAKIKLQIYNDSGSPITINSVTLTSLTANPEDNNNTENLLLLPKLTSGQNTMESTNGYHGDIQPNLYGTPAQVVYEYIPATDKNTISADITSISDKDPVEFTFYVNESDVRKSSSTTEPTAPNATRAAEDSPDFYHFFLKIMIDKGDNEEEELRYTLIDDKRTDDGEIIDDWGYIARNDYRIIPIVLDDYKLDMIPYDFPAIGVYPASVKEEDGIYTVNFHDYGHFHLVPQVTRYNKTPTEPTDYYVPFTTAEPKGLYEKTTWGLVNDKFEDSWGSWTDATKATVYENNTGGFYRDQTADKDGDEAGGEPVWYPNNENPTWSADANYSGPFIFGYINQHPNPGADGSDRKVYHEFSIYLYKQGMSAPRQMTYRLYMILDRDQMMYPATPSRTSSAPRCSHHWH